MRDRPTDRQTDIYRETKTDRQTDRDRETQRDRHRQTDRDTQRDREIDIQGVREWVSERSCSGERGGGGGIFDF